MFQEWCLTLFFFVFVLSDLRISRTTFCLIFLILINIFRMKESIFFVSVSLAGDRKVVD